MRAAKVAAALCASLAIPGAMRLATVRSRSPVRRFPRRLATWIQAKPARRDDGRLRGDHRAAQRLVRHEHRLHVVRATRARRPGPSRRSSRSAGRRSGSGRARASSARPGRRAPRAAAASPRPPACRRRRAPRGGLGPGACAWSTWAATVRTSGLPPPLSTAPPIPPNSRSSAAQAATKPGRATVREPVPPPRAGGPDRRALGRGRRLGAVGPLAGGRQSAASDSTIGHDARLERGRRHRGRDGDGQRVGGDLAGRRPPGGRSGRPRGAPRSRRPRRGGSAPRT